MSIAKTVLESNEKNTFTLFYNNKYSNTIIFKEALEDLKNSCVDRLKLHHILSEEPFKITKDRIKSLEGKTNDKERFSLQERNAFREQAAALKEEIKEEKNTKTKAELIRKK